MLLDRALKNRNSSYMVTVDNKDTQTLLVRSFWWSLMINLNKIDCVDAFTLRKHCQH